MTPRLSASIAGLALALVTVGAVRAQTRTSLLHDALRLSSDQERAWAAFQASAAPDAQTQAQARQAAALAPTLPTPRRLALVRAQMQADLTAFDRTARAVEAFYATLTPEQQATFDRETADGAGARRP